MNRKEALVFGLTALGTGLVIRKLWTLMDIGDKVSFVISSLRVQKITAPKNILDVAGYNAQIRLGLRIYNPSNQTILLQIPSVKVLYRGNIIAISAPDGSTTIIPQTSAAEKTLAIDVPLHTLTNAGIMNDVSVSTDKLSALLATNLSFDIIAKVNGVTISTNQTLAGTGLALSAGPRTVKDGTRFNRYFAKADNLRKTVKRSGEVNDVVEMAIRIIRDHHQEAAQIAQVLKGRTVRETASNLFDFAYDYLQYRRDTVGVEELRTPARSWHDGQVRHKQMGIESAGIDCDDYSIFCGSVLQCLGIPFRFRITKYNGRDFFQHIYVYIPQGDGHPEIIIDPVLDRFDYEKPFSDQKDDFNMASLYAVEGLSGMPIEMLSGFNGMGDVSSNDLLDRTYDYIVQTRNAIAANPSAMKNYTGANESLLAMFDDAIKYWHTPIRDQVLDRIATYEEALEKAGIFRPMQGLNGELQGGFFKKVGKLAKSVAKNAITVAKVAAPAVAALTASNPFTAALAPIAIKAATTLTKKAASVPKVASIVNTVTSNLPVVNALSAKAPINPLPIVNNAINAMSAKTTSAPTMKSAPVANYTAPVVMAAPIRTVANTSPLPQALPPTPAEEYFQSLVPAQTQSFTQANNETMSTTNNTTEQEGSFLSRNKKPLLIVGGALLLGTAAVVLLKPSRKEATRPMVAARSEQRALAGPPVRRKRKTAKRKNAAPKRNPAKGKKRQTRKTRSGVRKVTLR